MSPSRCLILALLLSALSACAQDADLTAQMTGPDAPADAIWLDSLDMKLVTSGWGDHPAQAGKSIDLNPIKLAGVTYPHGIGTHAISQMSIDLKGVATRFVAMVGVDDEKQGMGSVVFRVLVDGEEKVTTKTLRGGDQPVLIDLDITGAKRLGLIAEDNFDGIDSDHADWAGALLFLKPGAEEQPVAVNEPAEPPLPAEPPYPLAGGDAAEPQIHGPKVVGTTPGRPFLFLIPATGDGPLKFSAEGLPKGLKLDPNSGIIDGAVADPGETEVVLKVTGAKGETTRSLRIVAGEHKLAQTPPLGWNSWNVFAGQIDDAKVRATADAMVASGLAAHGFQYVNIDDHWEAGRDKDGWILSDPDKFPDMKALSDYVHSKGLKLGIYSSPGPKTCGGEEGSYQHELQDAKRWAEWGIDYLKHDWCSYGGVATGEGLERLQKPYLTMRDALDQVDRDIVYSLCQYGMGEVWTWGTEVGANCWRTTGDITDTWDSMSRIGFGGVGRGQYAGPGHWNDPDMMVVGKLGWGRPRDNRMTPNEQLTHVTLWVLQSSPILLGCDLTQLDDFTLTMLKNDEAIDVHQDPLGHAADRVYKRGTAEIWARPLSDGTMAVGLFNRGRRAETVTCRWDYIDEYGAQPVRDLWQRQDVGEFNGEFGIEVAAHGCRLLKVGTPK